jgi:hypothetical protein
MPRFGGDAQALSGASAYMATEFLRIWKALGLAWDGDLDGRTL